MFSWKKQKRKWAVKIGHCFDFSQNKSLFWFPLLLCTLKDGCSPFGHPGWSQTPALWLSQCRAKGRGACFSEITALLADIRKPSSHQEVTWQNCVYKPWQKSAWLRIYLFCRFLPFLSGLRIFFLLGSFRPLAPPNILNVRKIAIDGRLSIWLWIKEKRALKYLPWWRYSTHKTGATWQWFHFRKEENSMTLS